MALNNTVAFNHHEHQDMKFPCSVCFYFKKGVKTSMKMIYCKEEILFESKVSEYRGDVTVT